MKKTILSMVLLSGSLFQAVQAEGVYIGEYGANGSTSTSFDAQQLPVEGDVIRASKSMNLRDDRPRVKNQQWEFGGVTGAIYPGERFVIEEVVVSRGGSIPGDVWVKGFVKR